MVAKAMASLEPAGMPAARPSSGTLPARHPLAAVAAIAALGASAFCYVTGENLPIGLLPGIAKSLHTSLSVTGLLVTAYAAVIVAASAPLTHLTSNIPRRLLLSCLLGTFVVATLAAASAPGYPWLLAARVITALSQAVFWSIATVTAAGLLAPGKQGRAVLGVFAGSSLAIVVGIPASTWLGQQAGWRAAFVALAALGSLSLAAVAYLLPTKRPGESHARAGTNPDARRYRVLVATTALAIAAAFTSYTYVSAFLTKVSGMAGGDVAPVLLASGLTGALGVAVTGLAVGRHPKLATVAPVAVLFVAELGLYLFGTSGWMTVGLQMLVSLGISGVATSISTRVLIVAPRSTDIATAWNSAFFNVGIGGGPVVGGLVLSHFGLRSTPLAGAVLAAAALVTVLRQ